MSASDYLEDALLKHIFEGAAYTQPTIWVGLSTADPLDGGSGLAEPVGDGYTRVRPEDDNGRWQVSESEGVTTASNKGVIEFPEAQDTWGTITHAVLFDAATDGDLLAVVPVSIPRTIVGGDTVRMGVGSLTVTLD